MGGTLFNLGHPHIPKRVRTETDRQTETHTHTHTHLPPRQMRTLRC